MGVVIFLVAAAVGFIFDFKQFLDSDVKSKTLYIFLIVISLAILCVAEFSHISFNNLITIS